MGFLAVLFVIKEGPVFDSREIDDDLRLEYDKTGEVAGVEIMHATRNIARILTQQIAREIGAP